MKKLFLIPLITIVVSGLILGGCAKPAPTAAQPIRIGVMYPLTGPVGIAGEMIMHGITFGFEEAHYEVTGRKIEVIVEDSQMLPDMAVDKAKKLVEYDNVSMLIGPLSAPVKYTVGAYMAKMGVPHIATHPNLLRITEHEWSFMAGGSLNQYAYSMGLYAYDEMGLRTVTAITKDAADARGMLAAFKEAFTKRGGQVIQEQYAPFPCPDYASYLAALKDADAVVAWYDGADTIRFLTQFHEFGIRQRMLLIGMFPGCFFEPFILRELAPEVADAVIGERCPILYTSLLEIDASKRFTEAFKKKYDYSPELAEAEAYVGVQVALRALKATGGDTTPEKLRQAILALEFESCEGPFRFDLETRFPIKNTYIVEVDKVGEDYVLVPVHTYEDIPPRGY